MHDACFTCVCYRYVSGLNILRLNRRIFEVKTQMRFIDSELIHRGPLLLILSVQSPFCHISTPVHTHPTIAYSPILKCFIRLRRYFGDVNMATHRRQMDLNYFGTSMSSIVIVVPCDDM